MASKNKKDYEGTIVNIDANGNIFRQNAPSKSQTTTKSVSTSTIGNSNVGTAPTVTMSQFKTLADKNYEDKLSVFKKASDEYDKKRIEELNKQNSVLTRRFDNVSNRMDLMEYRDKSKGKTPQQLEREYEEKIEPQVEKATVVERENKSKALNDLRYAKYMKDYADIQNEEVNLYDQTLGQLVRGVGDVFSTITDENRYVDENGKVMYLPSYNAMKQEQVQKSYGEGLGGDVARFFGDVAHEGGKIATTTALNSLIPYSGTALYFSDIFADQYKENINEGYDDSKAIADAFLKSGQNYIKQRILGGLGGKLTGGDTSWLENSLNKSWGKLVSNPTAQSILASMSAEGIDEFTDTFIEAGIDAAVLGKEIDPIELLQESLYSGAVGAGTGAFGGVNGKNVNETKPNIDNNILVEQQVQQEQPNTQPIISTETPQIDTKPVENINAQPIVEETKNEVKTKQKQQPRTKQLQLGLESANNETINNKIKKQSEAFNLKEETKPKTSQKLEVRPTTKELSMSEQRKLDNIRQFRDAGMYASISKEEFLKNNYYPRLEKEIGLTREQAGEWFDNSKTKEYKQLSKKMNELYKNEEVEKYIPLEERGDLVFNAYNKNQTYEQMEQNLIKEINNRAGKEIVTTGDLETKPKGKAMSLQELQSKLGVKEKQENKTEQKQDNRAEWTKTREGVIEHMTKINNMFDGTNKELSSKQKLDLMNNALEMGGYEQLSELPSQKTKTKKVEKTEVKEKPKTNKDNIAERKSDEVVKESIEKKTDNIVKKFDNAKKGDVFKRVEEKEGKPLRQGVKTITTATGTTQLVSDMDGSIITYEPLSNKKTLDSAYDRAKGKSLEQRYKENIEFIKSDKRITADKIADIETTLIDLKNEFNVDKNVDMFLNLVQQASTLGTTDAQALQFMSVIKKLSPETQLDTLIKMVEQSKEKGEKTFEGVELNKDLVKNVLEAQDDEVKFNDAMDELKTDIAKQMKVDFIERVNAFRFLSMLGNVKTHNRNMLGNGAMYELQSFKDTIGSIGESLYDKTSKALGGKGLQERTKATFGSLRASQEVRNFVNNKVDTFFKTQKNNSKYSESKSGMLNDIKSKRKMFTEATPIGKALNKLYGLNTKALDLEDKFFSKTMTKKAMKSYLVANGIKTDADIEANPELVARALDYAFFKGQEATYHQDSTTATAINTFKEKMKAGSGFSKLGGLAVESTMPFVKTPVNIAKTSLEYTPLIGTLDLRNQLKNAPKELRGAIVIDNLSKQFTGLALMGLGIALAKSGKIQIKGAGEGDKEDEIEKSLGNASYSIKIGDSTYDLSWLAPTSIPLFEGVELYNKFAKNGEIDANTLIDTMFGALDPVTDMSVLQSVERLASALGSNSKNKGNLIQSAASQTFSSYLSQFVPTFFSQIAEFSDDSKRDAYTDKTVLGRTYDQIKYKIPGARQTLPESVDIWGETNKTASNKAQRFFEAFLLPANRKDYKVDETTKQLEELAKKTDTSVLPTKRESNVTINKENHKLTGQEYVDYKKTYGKTAKKQIEDLMKDSDYIQADDETKQKMIEAIYKYANYKYKKEYSDEHNIDYSNSQENKYAMVDAFNIPYYELESMRLTDLGKKKDKMEAISQSNLTQQQKDVINLIQTYKYYDADVDTLIRIINNSDLSSSQKKTLIAKIEKNSTKGGK